MILKPLSSSLTLPGLGLVLVLAAAATATTIGVGAVTTTSTAPSTANLGHSRPTPIAKALMMAIGSSLFSQTPPQRTTKEPSGQDDEEEEDDAVGPGTQMTRKVSGWPSSLKIEIDDLEVGGLTMPFIQTWLRNSKVGSKNFGNIDLVSPDSSFGALSLSGQGNAGQVVEYV